MSFKLYLMSIFSNNWHIKRRINEKLLFNHLNALECAWPFRKLTLKNLKAITTTVLLLIFLLSEKWSFPLRISSVNVTKSGNLVIFTEEILNGKLHFFLQCLPQKYFVLSIFLFPKNSFCIVSPLTILSIVVAIRWEIFPANRWKRR